MIHELKIWPQYFCRVAEGTKTFEVRKNDRGFQPGDLVRLREWDQERESTRERRFPMMISSQRTTYELGEYTGKELTFRIGYVLPINDDKVVFSLLPSEGVKHEKL